MVRTDRRAHAAHGRDRVHQAAGQIGARVQRHHRRSASSDLIAHDQSGLRTTRAAPPVRRPPLRTYARDHPACSEALDVSRRSAAARSPCRRRRRWSTCSTSRSADRTSASGPSGCSSSPRCRPASDGSSGEVDSALENSRMLPPSSRAATPSPGPADLALGVQQRDLRAGRACSRASTRVADRHQGLDVRHRAAPQPLPSAAFTPATCRCLGLVAGLSIQHTRSSPHGVRSVTRVFSGSGVERPSARPACPGRTRPRRSPVPDSLHDQPPVVDDNLVAGVGHGLPRRHADLAGGRVDHPRRPVGADLHDPLVVVQVRRNEPPRSRWPGRPGRPGWCAATDAWWPYRNRS